ncbi:hypothetical protein DFH28DRAFT_902451, partial [Melampsora americana]
EACLKLTELETSFGHTVEYLGAQWERQRKCQTEIMGDDRAQEVRAQLGRLIELEEDFKEAHDDLKKLRRKRRRNLSQEEHEALRRLPSTLVELEKSIVEAYVGKIEWQKKWSQPGLGTTEQGRYKNVMEKRNKALALKYSTYKSQVKSMDIANPFWNIGHLTHPDEPWAVNVSVQIGIQAFLTARSCAEEKERISCEIQHMMRSALQMEEKLANLHALSHLPWVDGAPQERRPLQLVLRNGLISKVNWEASQKVLQALHSHLQLKYCRNWMVWHTHLPRLIRSTAHYSHESAQTITTLCDAWSELIVRCSGIWEKILNGPYIQAQQLDEFERLEQDLLFHEEEMVQNNIDLLEEDMQNNLVLIDNEDDME